MRFFIYVIIFLVVASCSNTSIYNRTVTQGTVFKQDDIDRLEIGMSKDQVSFIMGQPSFQNIFDENVWDYYFQVKKMEDLLGICDYGSEITAVIGKDNIIGCQFHPEKSQKIGLKFIKNFINWSP